jgi:hypothetical protein
MSAFTDVEADFVEDDEMDSQPLHNTFANTDFTPVINPNANQERSSTTTPDLRPNSVNSVRSHSTGVSESLLRTTAARLNDERAWEIHQQMKQPLQYKVVPLPDDHPLLRPTKARLLDEQALEAHKLQKNVQEGPNFKIADEFYQVKSSLLRLTKARVNDAIALAARQTRSPSPPHFRVDHTYSPSDRLSKPTKVREADRQALEEKQHEHDPQKPKVIPKDYVPNDHLLLPTKNNVAAIEQWEHEKEKMKYSDDIWWNERKPSAKAKSRPETPSKLTSPTTAYLSARREKVKIGDEFQAHDVIPLPAPIEDNNRLLKPTKAVKLQSIDANREEIAPEYSLPLTPEMNLMARRTYGEVPSRLMEETNAAKSGKYQKPIPEQPKQFSPKAFKAPSERLTNLNSAAKHGQKEKVQYHQDPRENGWNLYTDKSPNYPCPSNRRNTNHLMKKAAAVVRGNSRSRSPQRITRQDDNVIYRVNSNFDNLNLSTNSVGLDESTTTPPQENMTPATPVIINEFVEASPAIVSPELTPTRPADDGDHTPQRKTKLTKPVQMSASLLSPTLSSLSLMSPMIAKAAEEVIKSKLQGRRGRSLLAANQKPEKPKSFASKFEKAKKRLNIQSPSQGTPSPTRATNAPPNPPTPNTADRAYQSPGN